MDYLPIREKALLILICFQITGCAPPRELESTSDESDDLRIVTIVSDASELPENCEYLETIEIISADVKITTSLEDVPIIPLTSIAVDKDVNNLVVQPDMLLPDRIGEGKGKTYSCR